MSILDKIIKLSNKYEEHVINLRRKIHQNPELSFDEYGTRELIINELEKLGIEYERGIAGTGILATLYGKEEGKVLLLRAEMDALPIEEDIEIDFKSVNKGVMHACGHDVHIANLLGVAKILSDLKEEFNGTIKFMFQPGEEKGGGGRKMIAEGILQNPKVDAAIALHIMPIRQGEILISNSNITAYSDGFTIKVYGKSAHTSKPQDGVDAINIAGNIIVSLNSIISKHLDPRDAATFSIGKIKGGTSNNIVPDYVELSGMIRATTKESRNIIRGKSESISKGIANTFGGDCSFEIREGYPSIFNDEVLTESIRNSFRTNYLEMIKDIDEKIYKENDINKYIINHKPLLTADDFGYISNIVPSTYYMVGTGDFAPGHSSKFFVDERYIKLCTRTMALAALEYLNDSKLNRNKWFHCLIYVIIK